VQATDHRSQISLLVHMHSFLRRQRPVSIVTFATPCNSRRFDPLTGQWLQKLLVRWSAVSCHCSNQVCHSETIYSSLNIGLTVPSKDSLVCSAGHSCYRVMASADLMCSTDSSVGCLSLVSRLKELGTAVYYVGVQLFCSGHHALLATALL